MKDTFAKNVIDINNCFIFRESTALEKLEKNEGALYIVV